MASISEQIAPVLNRPLVFVHGKGGVGKTVVSQAVALSLSKRKAKTLWIMLEDPTRPPGELTQESPYLWHYNCDFTLAFEEYAAMKIGVARLTKLFLQNKVMRYLAKAAPGIHELVLLGKIWYERNHYDHVVVDMPSTGYGLALFQSTENFARLFRGGPLHRDADAMLASIRDPQSTGHLIVALPEEMPLRESLELDQYLKKMFPKNPAAFLVNRIFPEVDLSGLESSESPGSWPTPLANSVEDYARKRVWLEKHNMRLWRDENVDFGELEYIPPSVDENRRRIVGQLAEQLQIKAYL